MTKQRSKIRLALPSKGRMEDETRAFLADCGVPVKKVNPRQYIATTSEIPDLEIWFLRTADIVRKVRDGDVDLGLVGYDKTAEYRGSGDSVVIVHDGLGFGYCRLSVGVPEAWSEVTQMADLAAMASDRTTRHPLRVVTKYPRLAQSFLSQYNVEPYHILHADGALEAAPQMGTADFIIDLVSSGVTMQENRLKELEDGVILESEMNLIGNRRSLTENEGVLAVAHELLERFEAHLRAMEHYTVVANMRGESPEAVAAKVFSQASLGGLQGPTISRVYLRDEADADWYAITIVVKKRGLHRAVEQLRAIGGSGVLVSPLTYIFEEEPVRWRTLLDTLGLDR